LLLSDTGVAFAGFFAAPQYATRDRIHPFHATAAQEKIIYVFDAI